MKFKKKPLPEGCDKWHRVFVWLPKHTLDGYVVFLGFVWRKYKPQGMSIQNEFVYQVAEPDKK